MHILFLNPQGNFDDEDSRLAEHPDFGGQLVYVKEIGMAMVDQGHTVDIVTRRIVDPEWPEFAAPVDHYTGYEPGLRIVRIPCGGDAFLPKEQLWDHLPEFISNTLQFYGDKLPDFVTAHYADGGYCALLLQVQTGLKFTFTGHSLGAQKLDKLGSDSSNTAEMEERFCFSRRIDAERLTMQRAFRIITSTRQERMKQYAHPLYRGSVDVNDDSRFAVIPPGVNTDLFTTEHGCDDRQVEQQLDSELRDPQSPHLLIASRIDEKKNIGVVVEAWAGSENLHTRTNLALCVRGLDDPWTELSTLTEEEQDVLRPILEMIENAGLRNKVEFLNIQSQSELAATYRYFAARGSLFLLPSVYEPFGLAPIEAAACGLACVATKNGGPSEIFEGGAGILVDPFDVQDIERGIKLALDRQPELSERGCQRVLDRYTWKKTATRYLEVIQAGVESGLAEKQAVPELDAGSRIRAYLDQRSVNQ
jgi:sucrose-phosphate synthase